MSEAAADATADLISAVKILPDFRGESSGEVPKERLVELMIALKKEGMTYLVDLTAVDNHGEHPRFEVVYELCDLSARRHLRVKTRVGEGEPVPSVSSVWKGADWHEREAFDMFGIRFEGHPDLRRILMWDGYPHHPLRKEFPLAGVETQLPDLEVAAETGTKVLPAPMAGGPFVASSGEMNLTEAEPRAKDESWNERNVKPE